MSAGPAGAARQRPPPEGRLVFDGSSEADVAVADRLYDSLFPPEPSEPRRPLYRHQAGDDSASASVGGGGSGRPSAGARSEEVPAGRDGGSAGPAGPWLEDAGREPLQAPEEQEPLSPAVCRVLERRQLTRERFARRQDAVRELQRRCGQRPARGAPSWTPPVLVYRPPPLAALQRRLLEAGELADTVAEPADRTSQQIEEFRRRHLPAETDDDTPR